MADSFGVSKPEGAMELDAVEAVLYKYMDLAVTGMRKELADNNIDASRQLSQSIRPEFFVTTEKFGQTYIAQIIMEDYYEVVDKGRGPNLAPPPVKNIVKWISQKEGFKIRGLDKIGDIRERGLKKRQKYTLQDIILSNAIAISRGIGKKGTKATNFYTNVINQDFYNAMNKELSEALKRDVTVEIKNLVDSRGNLATGEKRFQ